MAAVMKSRFDVLKVEHLSDDESFQVKMSKKSRKQQQQKSEEKKPSSQGVKNADSGKKNKPNKKPGQETQKQGGSNQSNKQKNSASKNGKGGQKEGKKIQDWETWKRVDTNVSSETYERDLQEALLLSRIEFEQTQQDEKETDETVTDDGKKKTKKRKEKPAPMSLEAFNETDEKEKKNLNIEETIDQYLEQAALPLRTVPEGEANPMFFDDVLSDVDKIIRQEKMTEEYQKQYAQESVRIRKLDEKIKRKDLEIKMLRTSMEKKDNEFQQVKKRNKQLCFILGQGEMKEKAEILMQADGLSQINGELTEQVTELTAELEKERSKVHSLETEVERLKSSNRHHSGK